MCGGWWAWRKSSPISKIVTKYFNSITGKKLKVILNSKSRHKQDKAGSFDSFMKKHALPLHKRQQEASKSLNTKRTGAIRMSTDTTDLASDHASTALAQDELTKLD